MEAGPDYGKRYVQDRLAGFEKDMGICLTGIPSQTRAELTHAYFPALSACCGFLEHLTALVRGQTSSAGHDQIWDFARRFMPQPDYNQENVRLFFNIFRHSVAHRGIAGGVWVDQDRKSGGFGRRFVWRVTEHATRPAIHVEQELGELQKQLPWKSPYTHRISIHLEALRADLRAAANLYCDSIDSDHRLGANFEKCMRDLYPPA